MQLIVTKIEEYIKSKYKIYLNDEFAFVLYKGELRRYAIELGVVFTEELQHEIMEVVLTKRAKLRAMHLLEKIDRTEADIRRKLRENLYPEVIINVAVEYVKQYHYIDDERYAKNYIHCKAMSMSQHEIGRKLLEKGVSKDIISKQLDLAEDRDVELIGKLIRKRCKQVEDLSYLEKNKLYAFLYHKGFAIDNIDKALRSISLDIT